MILHRTTPWARTAITRDPELTAAIEAAEPRDMLVTIGRGQRGWTCRILSPRREGVVAEAYAAITVAEAFRWAVADMEARQMLADAGVELPA